MGKSFCKIETKWCKYCKRNKCCFSNNGVRTPLSEIHRCPKREATRTVRLKDYLADCDFNGVMEAMIKYYPEEVKNEYGYLGVLNRLNSMKAKKTDWFIKVEHVHEDARDTQWGRIDESDWLNVTGIAPNSKEFAIEFDPWDLWLGMNICQTTLNSLTKNEIIAGILYEMTFSGFTEERINEEKQKIIDSFEEIKKMKK